MPSVFKRVFVHDFWLKAISLLLAFGLWRVVANSPNAEVEMKVPIELRNVPENLEIDSASFTEAQVRIRGTERLIRRLRDGDVRASVDLATVRPGMRTFDLSSRNIQVPNGLEVVQIIPGQFQLSFDDRVQRTVEIHPRVIGVPPDVRTEAEPAQITITGPRRRVESVEAATTDPVDASGTMKRATFITQAYVADPLIQVLHPTPVRVTVIMERSGEVPSH